jgi:hypothetical protein
LDKIEEEMLKEQEFVAEMDIRHFIEEISDDVHLEKKEILI